MTATEAAESPRVVRAIVAASGVGKRTVLKHLRGNGPDTVIRDRIEEAAKALGVDALPTPRNDEQDEQDGGQKPACADCATCAKLLEAEAEVTRLRALLAAPAPPAPVTPDPPPAPTPAPTPPVVALPPKPRPALQRVRLVEEGPEGQDLPVHVA